MPSQDTPKQDRQKAVFDQAIRAHRLGNLSVMPIGRNKRPSEKWKEWQSRLPNAEEMARNFPATGGPEGIGVITGKVSGNLEMLEFEGRAANLYDEMGDKLPSKLWRKVTVEGYRETTPSGGIHIYYRVEGGDVAGNTKLASRPATAEELQENPHEKTKVLIETRGEGGYSVIAPSGGEVTDARYPGGEWRSTAGALMFIPTITAAERDHLHDTARTFHVEPIRTAPQPRPESRPRPAPAPGELSPIDDFNARHTGEELIAAAGWTTNGEMRAGRVLWTRPGKNARDGHSATVDPETGNVYVFTTASELPDSRPLDAAGVYAWLNHGGDFSAASRQLRKDGYGTPRPAAAPPGAGSRWIDRTTPEEPATPASTGTDGLAPVTDIAKKRKVRGLAGYNYTDAGNARLMLDNYGDVIRYCTELEQWLYWTGKKWEPQPRGGGNVRRLAMQTMLDWNPDDEAGEKHKRKSLNAGPLRAMLDVAQLDPDVVVSIGQLDARPWEVNTPDGIVNLKTGELLEHDPAHLHTHMTKCGPGTEADRTVWLKFLDETFGGDAELIAYVQRALAYSIIGEVRENALFFCYGSGGNGKTVLLETVARIVGDYHTATPNRYLMEKKQEAHPTEIASLAGMRFAVGAEVKEEDYFDQERVKLFTGGDTLKARKMHKDEFMFIPTHHLWLMGNHKPQVRGGGGRSFWRRMKLIPFLHEVAPENVDTELQSKLIEQHGPAIMAWLVEGAVAYGRQGLAPEPAIVADAVNEYADAEDTLRGFIDDCCVIGDPPNAMLQTTVARFADAYTDWCKQNALPLPNTLRLGDKLKHYGVMVGRKAPRPANGGPRVYGNIMLRATPETEDPRDGEQGRFMP